MIPLIYSRRPFPYTTIPEYHDFRPSIPAYHHSHSPFPNPTIPVVRSHILPLPQSVPESHYSQTSIPAVRSRIPQFPAIHSRRPFPHPTIPNHPFPNPTIPLFPTIHYRRPFPNPTIPNHPFPYSQPSITAIRSRIPQFPNPTIPNPLFPNPSIPEYRNSRNARFRAGPQLVRSPAARLRWDYSRGRSREFSGIGIVWEYLRVGLSLSMCVYTYVLDMYIRNRTHTDT